MRILLVDDNALVLRTLRDRLQEEVPDARVVFEARTEGAARAWLAGNREGWDLAIVDLFLPDGNGFKVLRDCTPRLPHQRAVVLSNYTAAHVHAYVRDAGADRFFDKNTQLDALLEFVQASQKALKQA